MGSAKAVAHKIITSDNKPINIKNFRQPPIHKKTVLEKSKEYLREGIIQPSLSPYNSPVWIVPKKPDSQGNKQWRMVIDYRGLNEKTINDSYSLPLIKDILDQLGGAKYFSVMDLASGFHQIPMDPESKAKTAFSTPYAHYEFNRMPFGLKNAPATFQKLMGQVLTGLQGNELFVYMDDIVIYASSLVDHSQKLKVLLGRLKTSGLSLQPEKCHFLKKEIVYLGHIITQEGVKPDPRKVEAVKNFPIPKGKKNIKQFLGLVGYYRRFIPDFAKISKPLTLILKDNVGFRWSTVEQEAFEILRDKICSEPLLQYPDFTKPFILTTDASKYSLRGVLSQGKIGQDLPIAYASRTLQGAEINYSTIEKELLAIVFCVHHFRPYLYGHKFILVTDRRPLVWLHSIKDPVSRLARWRIKLSEYNYEIVYKPGRVNSNADALSRNPHDGSDSLKITTDSTYVRQKGVEEKSASNEEIGPDELMERVFVCFEALEVRAMGSSNTRINRIKLTSYLRLHSLIDENLNATQYQSTKAPRLATSAGCSQIGTPISICASAPQHLDSRGERDSQNLVI